MRQHLFLSFRIQLWQCRWIQRPRFPIRVGYFGNRSTRSVLLWHFLSRKPPCFYFGSAWPNFLKSGTRVSYPGEVDTFHQIWSWSDHSLPRHDTVTSNTLRSIVTLRIDLLTSNSCRKFFVMRSSPPPTLASHDYPFLSYDVHILTAIGNTNSLLAIVLAQYHVTYLVGVDINHIFESHFEWKLVGACDLQFHLGKTVTKIVYFTYSPKAPTYPIVTKFSLRVYFLDVINCAKYRWNPFRGFNFINFNFRGWNFGVSHRNEMSPLTQGSNYR